MKTAEFLGKAIEENLYDLEDRQRFHRTQKPLAIKKIIDYTLLKLISSVFLRKKKTKHSWNKIFTWHISDCVYVSQVYKELLTH